MLHLPSMRQLQYFQALSETLHFGTAAEQCAVSQSTLSAGIKELEERIGGALAERTNRSVNLTPLGKQVAETAQAILLQAADLLEMSAQYRHPLNGPLHLGVIPTIAPFLLPRRLGILRRHFPDLQLYLHEGESQEILDQLHKGIVDLVLFALPYATEGLETEIIGKDPFYLVVPKDHILAARPSITYHEFEEAPLLLLNEGHCLRDQALTALEIGEESSTQQVRGASLHTIVQMAANGLGTTLLPKMALDAGLLNGTNLNAIALRSSHASRDIALAWRKSTSRTEEFRLFGRYLSGELP